MQSHKIQVYSQKVKVGASRQRLIAGVLLVIVIIAVGAWLIWHKPTPKPVKPNPVVHAQVVAPDPYQAVRGTISGKIVSINTGSKIIIVNVNNVPANYAYSDSTIVQTGVAEKLEPFSVLKPGLQVNMVYNSQTKLVEDIWYASSTK